MHVEPQLYRAETQFIAGSTNSVTPPCHDDFMVVSTLVERLEAVDIGALDSGEVVAALRDLDRLKGFVTETEHALARRANALAASGSGAPADELIGRRGTCSKRQAERISRRAEAMGSLPAMSGQLGKGRIGVEHADTLVDAVRRLDDNGRTVLQSLDEELATAAAASTPAQFRRYVERVVDQLAADQGLERAARQRDATSLTKGINSETGMYWLRADFDPESGARLFRAIDAQTAALSKATDAASTSASSSDRSNLAARALVGLATSSNRTTRPGRVELLALVDLDTLVSGLRDHSVCEFDDGTDIPVATMRRLACDAHILPVVLGGDGVALDVGRSRRLATEDQRRALRAMYRTCGIGTCDVPFDRCEIHHVDEWGAHEGDTNLDRLIPSCSRHHHLVHEGGWQLELDRDTRELTITLPDGTIHERSRPCLLRDGADRQSGSVDDDAPEGAGSGRPDPSAVRSPSGRSATRDTRRAPPPSA